MRTLRKTHQSFVGSPFMVTEKRLTDAPNAIYGNQNNNQPNKPLN